MAAVQEQTLETGRILERAQEEQQEDVQILYLVQAQTQIQNNQAQIHTPDQNQAIQVQTANQNPSQSQIQIQSTQLQPQPASIHSEHHKQNRSISNYIPNPKSTKFPSHRALFCTEEDCTEPSMSEAQLQEHLEIAHQIKPFRCFIHQCGRSFSELCTYTQHLTTNHPDTTTSGSRLRCCSCTRSYLHNGSLISHYQTNHLYGIFPCNHCKVNFNTAKEVTIHRRKCTKKSISL